MKVELIRIKEDKNQTTGILQILDAEGWPVYAAPCIERGNRNNQKNISNVLPGTYDLVFEYSPKFKTYLWELKGTPGRTECKIHQANYWSQLNGCIAPGSYLKNINGDNYMDVCASKRALNDFHRVLKGLTRIQITIYKSRS